MYEIILADGTELKNLKLNGNTYISQEEVRRFDFIGNMSEVIVKNTEDDIELRMHNVELIDLSKDSEGWNISIREIPANEIQLTQLTAQVEYLAMMTDIDLEEL